MLVLAVCLVAFIILKFELRSSNTLIADIGTAQGTAQLRGVDVLVV